jgi:hypothetical protein
VADNACAVQAESAMAELLCAVRVLRLRSQVMTCVACLWVCVLWFEFMLLCRQKAGTPPNHVAKCQCSGIWGCGCV